MNEETKLISPAKMTEEQFMSWLEMEPEHTEKSEDGDYLHVPIAYLEPDLRTTFNGDIEIIIRKMKIKQGLLTIIVRLKVFHPVKKKYLKYDGIAGTLLQKIEEGAYKGSTKVTTLETIKPEIAACYSEAIKNASKKIGKRFGSDINRVHAPGKAKPEKAELKKKAIDSRVEALIDSCSTIPELNQIIPQLPNTEEVQQALNNKLKTLKKQKKS